MSSFLKSIGVLLGQRPAIANTDQPKAPRGPKPDPKAIALSWAEVLGCIDMRKLKGRG